MPFSLPSKRGLADFLSTQSNESSEQRFFVLFCFVFVCFFKFQKTFLTSHVNFFTFQTICLLFCYCFCLVFGSIFVFFCFLFFQRNLSLVPGASDYVKFTSQYQSVLCYFSKYHESVNYVTGEHAASKCGLIKL